VILPLLSIYIYTVVVMVIGKNIGGREREKYNGKLKGAHHHHHHDGLSGLEEERGGIG